MVHSGSKRYDLKVTVITVSSTRTIENDETGEKIAFLLRKEGYVTNRFICRDNESEILKTLFCNYDSDVFIFNGGTGASKLDLTIQSISKISSKEISGFGELFRQKSGGIFPYISNASLFIRDDKQIYCIPGSPDAVEIGFNIIKEMMNHIYEELKKE